MSLYNWVVNSFNAALGRNQKFEQLLKSKDIGRALTHRQFGESGKGFEGL